MDDTNKVVPFGGSVAEDCRAMAYVINRIGDKWTVFVVGALSLGPRRYGEIRRMVSGISQRMLTSTLKSLEEDGLVTRTLYPAVPPRVDYELTALGLSLIEPLHALYAWAAAHRQDMDSARAAFAARG